MGNVNAYEKGGRKMLNIIENAESLKNSKENDAAVIEKAVEKKLRMISHKPLPKQKESMRQFLIRQGYNPYVIREIMEKYFGSNSDFYFE